MLARPTPSSVRQLARVAAHAQALTMRNSIAPAAMAGIIARRFDLPAQCVPSPPTRAFTTTSPLLKKGGNSKKGKSSFPDPDADSTEDSSSSSSSPAFDFTTHYTNLDTSLTKLLTKLKDDLQRLHSTISTSDPTHLITAIEALPIPLTPPAPLSDLAHVTPKPSSRRHILVTIHDASHTKKVTSAIQKADLNMQPVVEDPVNAGNVLTLQVPPPTREGREKVAEQAAKLGERVKGEVRLVRQDGLKKLKGLGKGVKGVKVDEVRKEEAKVEKLVKGVEDEVKKVVDGVKRAVMEN